MPTPDTLVLDDAQTQLPNRDGRDRPGLRPQSGSTSPRWLVRARADPVPVCDPVPARPDYGCEQRPHSTGCVRSSSVRRALPPMAGSVMVTVDPATLASPACRRAVARTRARPRPEPGFPAASEPRQKRSKACWASAGSSPGPSSLTVSIASPSTRRRATTISPSAGPWTSALSSRLSSARRSASGSPMTVTGSPA